GVALDPGIDRRAVDLAERDGRLLPQRALPGRVGLALRGAPRLLGRAHLRGERRIEPGGALVPGRGQGGRGHHADEYGGLHRRVDTARSAGVAEFSGAVTGYTARV